MSTTTSACTQPGCTGHILDGYCDVCGSPPSLPPPLPPSGTPHRAPGRERARTRGIDGDVGRRGRRRALDRLARLQPAGVHRARLGPGRARQHGRHPAGRHLLDPAARRPPRRRADHRAGDPRGRRRQGDPEGPAGPRGQAGLPVLRGRGRALPRRPARADRGVLLAVPQPVLVHPQAACRRPRGRPVRGGRRHRPRRPRLGLRRPRPQRLRPLGRAQGPAQLRRPRRRGRRDRRAAVPRPGRAPAHRRDLQLRDARRRRLHRHGVRRRHVAEGAAQGPDAGRRGPLRPAAGGPGDRLRHRDPAGVPVPPRHGPGLLRLQAGQHHPGRRRGQAHRHGRRAPDRRPRLPHLRHRRLPGTRGAAGRHVRGLRHLHHRAHPDGAGE